MSTGGERALVTRARNRLAHIAGNADSATDVPLDNTTS
jgi:hypothetical protein